MKKILLALLAFLAISVGSQASAQTVWRDWGEAPFASSKEEAVRRLPDALRLLNVPEPVRALLEDAVRTTPNGVRTHIVPGDRFVAMMSRGDRVLSDVVVAEVPVTLPHGRTGAVQAANASMWEVTYEGQIYTLVLPDVCFNWSWRSRPAPVQQEVIQPDCVELSVSHISAGDRMTMRIRPSGAQLPPSQCWAYKQGSDAWQRWPECLTCFVAEGPMTLRLPREVVANHELEICWEHQGRPSLLYVVQPSDWQNTRYHEVPDLMTIREIPRPPPGS